MTVDGRIGGWALAGMLLAAFPPAAPAQESKRVEPVVVTATRIETPAAEVGTSVSVVTEEDFKTYHYATVDEALRNVPGIEIRRSGSLGKTTSITIRGATANQVQVLVDGVRVKSPTTGQADLSDISPDLIERIEIIRGPQSTLYGADAIGGVVHIITKRGKGPFSASVQQEVGNYDTLRSRVSGGGQWKILDYSFAASHLESNGQFRNDGSDENALSGRLGVALPWDSHLAFVARWNRTDTDLPVKFVCCGPLPVEPLIDVNQRQQSETLVLTLEGRTRPVPWWESRGRISRYENSMGFQDPVDPGYAFDFPSFAQINVERREAEWINAFHVGKWSTSTVGIEYRHEEGENKGVFRSRTHTQSVFFEEQLRFFDRLFLTGGFRVEDHSVFGTETTERGSLAYVIKPWGTRIRGGAGSGFRAPTLNDLFYPDFSNPALKPERSFSWEVGADQKLWQDRIRLGLTYFHNDFENLIRFVSIPVAPFVAVVNLARARTAGIEATSEVDLLKNLVASVNYTYTDSETQGSNRPLAREPRHRWNVGLTWEPIRRLSLFTQVHTSSRQFESETVGYNRGNTRVDVGGTYRVLDRYGWLQALELTARVQNLLDEGYAEVRGFPALGTQALVGMRASF
ncbi:MAG: TonB-dependent receptor [Candidatus Rokubacteria bacterium]|nr:TonB-dependent receptor [Candidatus Rokubacteria bacterium]